MIDSHEFQKFVAIYLLNGKIEKGHSIKRQNFVKSLSPTKQPIRDARHRVSNKIIFKKKRYFGILLRHFKSIYSSKTNVRHRL